jgi:rare lipoprotein A
MSSNATRRCCARALCAVVAALTALPATGWASSGGAGIPTASPPPATNPSPTVSVGNATASVSATAGGITLQSRSGVVLRQSLQFSGVANGARAGSTIEIERLGHETNWRWAPTVSATLAPGGSFSAVWNTDHIGRFSIRAIVLRSGQAQAAAAAAPAVTVTVYRPSLATQYGPGFYGHRTACGERLAPSTIGVASRTLACGEPVAIMYDGRTLTVPVIDRGPYANHADWDLTMATGRALGIAGTAQIDAVSLPSR